MIVDALAELGHAEPRLTAMLLQGVVDAAVRRIELGAAEHPDVIVRAAVSWPWTASGAEAALPSAQAPRATQGNGTPSTGRSRDGPRCSSHGGSSESGSR